MRKYNGNLTRINKTKARKLYDAGKTVFFIPCNMNPELYNIPLGIWENKNMCGQYPSFDQLYNAFCYYNCNAETGKYIAFYIKKEAPIDE